jgi:hypothetical protein
MKINWIPSCNHWMCKVLYQWCSKTICQACSMVLFHPYLGFLYHNQSWWCGTRDIKKRKGGREWYCSKNIWAYYKSKPKYLSLSCWIISTLNFFLFLAWPDMLRKQKGGVFVNTRHIFMRANLQRFDRHIKFS